MESDRKTYLVTGCAGFIANQVAHLLLRQGHQVVGIDNMNDYYDVTLKEFRLSKLATYEQFKFFHEDLENRAAVASIFDDYQFDAVINLAARAGVRFSLVEPTVYMTTNAMANLYLLEEMRTRGIKKYVLASTSSLYAGQPMPFVETSPVNTPLSPYAASKKSAEIMAYAYHHNYDLDVSIVRYSTVYGPASRPDMAIFRFIKWIDEDTPITLYGDGTQSRDFAFVDDIARGTIAAIEPTGYEVINLSGGNQPVSINSIIEKLGKIMGKKAKINQNPFHKADMKTTWMDISKAKKLLGWSPTVSLDEGLEKCVRWHAANQPWSGCIRIN